MSHNMMTIDVITIFPEFFTGILSHGMVKRAVGAKAVAIRLHNLRDFTDDPHRSVDDRPFGGGPGMVFKPEPVFRAVEAIRAEASRESTRVILFTPHGRVLTQRVVEELGREERLILICGRYEGVDERVARHLATDEISIGDYVLSGGELPAAVVIESIVRLLPGVLGNEESSQSDSFSLHNSKSAGNQAKGLVGYPQYTRPAEFRGWRVPEVLLSGNHRQIRRWREEQSLARTCDRRPDLLASALLRN